MQNFRLLKLLGQTGKPILLKRGLANTLEELLMSAEYIMSGGNEQVILCERGIRTFEPSTRNTLDISAVPMLKRLTHLPVVVDPSHAGGISWLVEPLAKAAVAAGADGLMIEMHPNPAEARSDGAQSLNPQAFEALMHSIKPYIELEGEDPMEGMTIGIIGLGADRRLFCKGRQSPHARTAYWRWIQTRRCAAARLKAEAADEIISPDALSRCDVVIVALYPD